MNLPYTIELRQDADEGWFVRVRELHGCMSEGDTAEEAVAMIQEAMQLWLEVALEEGIPIPEPRPEEDYSGKFVVRVPRSLHRELVEEAAQQGTSLNQYINVALARSVGRLVPARPAADEGSGWPGLKAAVRQALVTAGLSEEGWGTGRRAVRQPYGTNVGPGRECNTGPLFPRGAMGGEHNDSGVAPRCTREPCVKRLSKDCELAARAGRNDG